MLLHVSVKTPSLMYVIAATQRRLASSVATSTTVAEQISDRYRCHSNSQNPLQRRPVGGIAASATDLSAKRWNSTMTRPSLRQVHPSLQNKRPLANGVPVAFHMKDLVNNGLQSDSSSLSSSDSTGTTRSSSSRSTSSSSSDQKKRSYESDLIVVLDMDECLIHSKFLSSPAAAQVYAHQVRRQHNHEKKSAGVDSTLSTAKIVDWFNVTLPDGDLVHVNVRPGLTDFLEQVTARYETHIFTAAMEVYAKPVLDKLDPNGTKFAGRWYRETCQSCPEHGAYIKNLRNLPHSVKMGDMTRIVLVDNNPLSFLAQPNNGILVSNFYNDPTDSTLPAVWQLLQELENCEDVRPILQERFRLKEALKELDAAARVA